MLRLAAHCRGLGFSLAETKDVIALVTASEPDCPPPDQMNAIVENRLQTVRGEIRELERKVLEAQRTQADREKQLADRHVDITKRRLELYQAQQAAAGGR